MLKRKGKLLLIALLVVTLTVPTYFSFVSSSSGFIRINTTGNSNPGQQVQAGSNVNLYLGDVIWTGGQFYLFLSSDGSNQMGSGLAYTPIIDVYDVMRITAVSNYKNEFGTWTIGYGWVNGTIPATQNPGNYYIKAVDGEVGSTVAITDTSLMITAPLPGSATLNLSPTSGPGGTDITFTGSGWLPGSTVDIFYKDPSFEWKFFVSATANTQGQIAYTCKAPDLMKSLNNYDTYETYTPISFKAKMPSGLIYSDVVGFDQYHRGLKTVGDAFAGGLYGNGTDLTAYVRVKEGDIITIAGKWFHSGSPINIRWDGKAVHDTVTSDQWRNAQIIGKTGANSNGSFNTTATIPEADAGIHYIEVEDSQTRMTVKVYMVLGYMSISPASGPGGATVEFTGSEFPESSTVDLYYRDSILNTWNYWKSTTSTTEGTIKFNTEIPDLKLSCYAGDYNNFSTPLSFRADVDGTAYAYADYTQFARGLTHVGSQVAYVLFGNGTYLVNSVDVRPGDNLYIAGKYFNPGVVYVKFDGTVATGSYNPQQWSSSIIVGSTTANQEGTFEIFVTVPTVDDGQHSIAVEDSDASLVVGIKVTNPTPTPTATPKPTTSPTTSPTTNPNPTTNPTPTPNLPAPTIDLTCKGTTTTSGAKVQINGGLSLNSNPVAASPILISYSVTGGNTWESLTLVNTDSGGSFSAVWYPYVTGNYLIKATSEATSSMGHTSKTVNLAITPNTDNDNVFTVNSNSTIAQFAFNSSSKILSFVATGESGTTGYVEAYIPTSILNDISQLTTYVDGQQVSHNSRFEGDSWIITFTYSHSQHIITMAIDDSESKVNNVGIPPYAIVIIAVIAVVAIVAAVVVLKRR